jgi:hypothetical protein
MCSDSSLYWLGVDDCCNRLCKHLFISINVIGSPVQFTLCITPTMADILLELAELPVFPRKFIFFFRLCIVHVALPDCPSLPWTNTVHK